MRARDLTASISGGQIWLGLRCAAHPVPTVLSDPVGLANQAGKGRAERGGPSLVQLRCQGQWGR